MQSVSRETSALLAEYAKLIIKWNRTINLVAPSTLSDLETRHFVDSLEVAMHCPEDCRTWCDIGSGGGLPGVVCAIALQDRGLRFTLIESDKRKAEFLRTVSRDLSLDLDVRAARSEMLPPLNSDVVSARAVAPLSKLIHLAVQHGADMATYLFPKGRAHLTELVEARDKWHFSLTTLPSRTEEGSVILKLKDISHV